MIDLYLAGTANGYRACVALEEAGLPYRIHKIDLAKGESNTPEFLKLNPAGPIPVIVHQDGPGGKPLMPYPNFSLRKPMIDEAGGFANLQRRGATVGARPGMQKGMKVLA